MIQEVQVQKTFLLQNLVLRHLHDTFFHLRNTARYLLWMLQDVQVHPYKYSLRNLHSQVKQRFHRQHLALIRHRVHPIQTRQENLIVPAAKNVLLLS